MTMKKYLAPILLLTSLTAYAELQSNYRIAVEEKCGDFPKVGLNTIEDSCLGLVASEKDGLLRPRRIVQLDDGDFIITDMVAWGANRGIVWRLSPNKSENKLTKLFTKVDRAHGLAIGPKGLVYIGTPSTIFRFNPNNPTATRENIITDLPKEGNHPMTHFIFDNKGDLIVNVGAPTDQCHDENKKILFPCPQGKTEAVLRKYIRDTNGQYKSHQIIASGLRNSMALAQHPETGDLFQGENNMDFKELEKPEEEINLITQGKHYGWPYCYANGVLNPNYARYKNRINCNNTQVPAALLPAHSAPLDMLFYKGDMFPELNGKLIIALHGYRETGQRIVTLDFNQRMQPLELSRSEIVGGWAERSGLNPKGSPTGMTVAQDGSIWFVEDKNKTVMVLRRGSNSQITDPVDRVEITKLTLDQTIKLKNIQNKTLENNSCIACHGQLEIDSALELTNELVNNGWIIPGDSENSLLVKKISGESAGRQMPLDGEALKPEEIEEIKEFIDSL
jgi:glucose/arabinose dehydrogenase